MNNPAKSRETIKAAADAVVEYTLISFEARFLLWEKMVNLGVAERIWNAHARGIDPLTVGSFSEPAFAELVRTLAQARQRWAEETFQVHGLDIQHRGGELLVVFDLTWNEGESFQPCEIAVDFCTRLAPGRLPAGSPHHN